MPQPQDFRRIVKDKMEALGWTPYRLAKACKGHVSDQTVYNYLAGRDVTSDTLGVIFSALGLIVIDRDSDD